LSLGIRAERVTQGSRASPPGRRDRPSPEPSEPRLQTARAEVEAETWKVYALINHDLSQIFIGALSVPMSQIDRACKSIAAEIEDWEPARQNVAVSVVEQFPTQRHAKAYAAWLLRDGAFEGVEHYAMGLDSALA
jgi:hypothetical protein